ncbi:MAG: hypothetical protein HYY87_01020 [Candidatus Levybacteria bacterium]|nr:hypothetical protein [Candidatus Levybacteria bacterium]
MAVELEAWLIGRLDQLPLGDPDRAFLEATLRTTKARIGRGQNPSPHQKGGLLSSGEHLAQTFIDSKKGPFLQLEEVARIKKHTSANRN